MSTIMGPSTTLLVVSVAVSVGRYAMVDFLTVATVVPLRFITVLATVPLLVY